MPDLSWRAPSSSCTMPLANWALPEASCWAPSRSSFRSMVSFWPVLPTCVEGGLQGAARGAQCRRQRDRGVLRVDQLLADLWRELMCLKLALQPAQSLSGTACHRIRAGGQLLDNRRDHRGGGVLRRRDRADLVGGLPDGGDALLQLIGVAADERERLAQLQQRVGGLVDSRGELIGACGELRRA